MKYAASRLVAFGCVLLVSIGCSSSDDLWPTGCRLDEWRCNGSVLERCESNLVTGHWVAFRNCSAYNQVCTNDGALCSADGVTTPCCH